MSETQTQEQQPPPPPPPPSSSPPPQSTEEEALPPSSSSPSPPDAAAASSTPQKQQRQPNADQVSSTPKPGKLKLNLKSSTREELAEFIKSYLPHTKQVEAKLKDVTAQNKVLQARIKELEQGGCDDSVRDVGNGKIVVSDDEIRSLVNGIRQLKLENARNKALVEAFMANYSDPKFKPDDIVSSILLKDIPISTKHQQSSATQQSSVIQQSSTQPTTTAINNNDVDLKRINELEEENKGLKAKIQKLQVLLSKAKDQYESKSKLILEKNAEIGKLKNDLARSDAISEEAQAKLLEEADAIEKMEETMRAIRREAAQQQEALELRARAAESELLALHNEFESYKERAKSAITATVTSSNSNDGDDNNGCVSSDVPSQDVSGLLGVNSENDALRTRILSLEEQLKKAEYERESAIKERNTELQSVENAYKARISELQVSASIKYEGVVSELNSARRESESKIRSLQQELQASQKSLSEANDKAEQLQAENKELHERIETAEEEITNIKNSNNNNNSNILSSSSSSLDDNINDETIENVGIKANNSKINLPETFENVSDMSTGVSEVPEKVPTTSISPMTLDPTASAQQQQQQQQPLLYIASMQAQKDGVISDLKKKVAYLESENKDLEELVQHHVMQESVLKDQIRRFDGEVAAAGSGGVNVEYLKNIIVKYMETDEHERLIPVIAMLLKITPDEVKRINEMRRARMATQNPAAAVVSPVSKVMSLFSFPWQSSSPSSSSSSSSSSSTTTN